MNIRAVARGQWVESEDRERGRMQYQLEPLLVQLLYAPRPEEHRQQPDDPKEDAIDKHPGARSGARRGRDGAG